jgi:hypothetical protein
MLDGLLDVLGRVRGARRQSKSRAFDVRYAPDSVAHPFHDRDLLVTQYFDLVQKTLHPQQFVRHEAVTHVLV